MKPKWKRHRKHVAWVAVVVVVLMLAHCNGGNGGYRQHHYYPEPHPSAQKHRTVHK